MINKLLYERYHRSIKLQKKVITIGDFTYKNTLIKIDKYIPSSGSVLDIGSATGTISFYLGSRGLNVDGIELSRHAIKYANLNNKMFSLKNVNFINSSIENYKTSKKYDLITCFEVLEHIKKDVKCLKKINDFMRNTSFLAISVPSINAPLYKLGLLDNFDRRVGHLRRYSIHTIKEVLNKAGFIAIEEFKTEGVFRSIFFTNRILGFFLKLNRFKIFNEMFSYIDDICLKIFPESQLILICRKK